MYLYDYSVLAALCATFGLCFVLSAFLGGFFSVVWVVAVIVFVCLVCFFGVFGGVLLSDNFRGFDDESVSFEFSQGGVTRSVVACESDFPVYFPPLSLPPERSRRAGAGVVVARVFAWLFLFVLLAGLVCFFVFRQQFVDSFMAVTFRPSRAVVQVSDRLGLTGEGRRVFFATHPTVSSRQGFGERCAGVQHDERAHVLGCYVGDRIHLFAVDDARIDGVVEVTAAHELLHAVFARLSVSDREVLASRLLKLFDEVSVYDEGFRKRMSVYESLPKEQFVNELHSVFGTEVRSLPVWLEEHYGRWFVSRAAVLDCFDSYHDVFVRLEERSVRLRNDLDRRLTAINARIALHGKAVEEYNGQVAELNRLNSVFAFSDSPDEFYGRRDELLQRGKRLGAAEEQLRSDIEAYNSLVLEYNETAAENRELAQKLDSDLRVSP